MGEFTEAGLRILERGAELVGYSLGNITRISIDSYIRINRAGEEINTSLQAFLQNYDDLRTLEFSILTSLKESYLIAKKKAERNS